MSAASRRLPPAPVLGLLGLELPLAPGVRMTFSKSGVSYSAGTKGYRVTKTGLVWTGAPLGYIRKGCDANGRFYAHVSRLTGRGDRLRGAVGLWPRGRSPVRSVRRRGGSVDSRPHVVAHVDTLDQ
jgi:hypothetical protein